MPEITIPSNSIRAIIGLGNPGPQYQFNRHNIGFRVVDALAERHGGEWKNKEHAKVAHVQINGVPVILIKPQTFMNDSGKVVSFLTKQGSKPEHILVVHDELELPFGQLKIKIGGSHKGHNGLRSIMVACGDAFARLRFGIGRPENRDHVSGYVLENFRESKEEVERLINEACLIIESMYTK